MIFYDLKQNMTNATVYHRVWFIACVLQRTFNNYCSLPFLRPLFFSISIRIRTRRPHKLRPFRPSTRRTRRPRWQGPARWPHCWSLKCRPRQRIQQLDNIIYRQKLGNSFHFSSLTRQAPPPLFSFHHFVFSLCNLPISWSFSTAPLIAVL